MVWAGDQAVSLGMRNERGNEEEGKAWEVRCNVRKLVTIALFLLKVEL